MKSQAAVPISAREPRDETVGDQNPPVAAPAVLESAASPWRILQALAILVALWWAQAVLIPVVLSVLISYAFEPLVVRLETWRIKRAVAAPLLMGALLFAVVGTGYGLRHEAIGFVNRIPVTIRTVSRTIQDLSRGTTGTVARIKQAARELETATGGQVINGVAPVRVEEPTFKWSDWLWQGSRSLSEFGWQMFAVICLTYYLLASGDLYKRKFVRMVPTLSEKKVTVQILNEIDRQIERFLLARAAISVIVGLVIWIAFGLIGLADSGVWGVLSALLFAIPIAGPTVVVIASVVAAFAQYGSLNMAALVGAVAVGVGALEGYVLTPWLLSRVGEMNAVAVFVSLLFWGWLWGMWGLLLAVPITAAMKAASERIPELNPLAELLKD